MTQSQALLILKTGANVFLTGEPGSGKTYVINQYTAYLRKRGIEPAITASTGIAATHIGGMTIHSWSGIGIKKNLTKQEIHKISTNKSVEKRIRHANILIVDEVSMLLPETLSSVDAVCRTIKNNQEPFGGIQVVLVGDFFQLPPVVRTDTGVEQGELFSTPEIRFAYDSDLWENLNFKVCYLTEQHRQDDVDFFSILSSIRQNSTEEKHIAHIKNRKIDFKNIPKDIPKLFPHNSDVDRLNSLTLKNLAGGSVLFSMESSGFEPIVASLKKGCLSPEKLYLKKGASVMFTKNSQKDGFVNGTLGIVSGFSSEDNNPIITIQNGKKIHVEPMEWTIEENGKIRARISQLPLRLAWAFTIHKSQGISLDSAVMDLSTVFEYGQGYVALSRVRRLSGLYILGWNERTFQVHPEVLVKDEGFRKSSLEEVRNIENMSSEEIDKMHKNFILSCSGKNIDKKLEEIEEIFNFEELEDNNFKDSLKIEATDSKNGFSKIRETFPKAYTPWSNEDDKWLKELFVKEKSVKRLTEIFKRKPGAIRSRLKKLGLIES